jgi:capsular polysaccharide export protein
MSLVPVLRIPPFPGARATALCVPGKALPVTAEEIDGLITTMARMRIGGTYWEAQPALPASPYILVRVRDERRCRELIKALPAGTSVCCWNTGNRPRHGLSDQTVTQVSGPCDPWHLLGGAVRVLVDADDELALLAAIAGVPLTCVGSGRFTALDGEAAPSVIARSFESQLVEGWSFADPYTGDPIGIADAIAHCGFWRALIDSNRDIAAAAGFAFWKRPTVEPLIWSGRRLRFLTRPSPVAEGQLVAVWRSRCSPRLLVGLERQGAELVEVEDGFIRSAGLGADCVPPLSIVVDRIGVHFDPTRSSELEQILEHEVFSSDTLERARQLRGIIVAAGVGKYGVVGDTRIERRVDRQRHILVPGQVEDDRSVLSGGGSVRSNLELLRRARLDTPEAYILYKPHPDVEAGHRVGAIADEVCLTFADEIVLDEPISALIAMVDELQVNTSLAGFEALLRGKAVTTHGVPFYAGWGLTRDLGPVPPRRTARRTLDELVSAVLLRYPRYLDPETGLPCPAEILIRRLSSATGRRHQGVVVQLRRMQGRYNRYLDRLRGA